MRRVHHIRRSRRSVDIDGGIIGIVLAIVFLIIAYFYYEANSMDAIFTRLIMIPVVGEMVQGSTYWIGALVIAGIIYWISRENF